MAQTIQDTATPTAANGNPTTPGAVKGNPTTPSSKAAATPTSPNSDKASLLTLPLARVERMMMENEDVAPAHHEAKFLIARATELFIDGLSSRTAAQMREAGKGVAYSHVAQAVGEWAPCDFLQDVVPKKMTAAELLDAMTARKNSR